MAGETPIEPPERDRLNRSPKLRARRPDEPRDPRLVAIVRRLLRACGTDPHGPDWRAAHAALVAEYRHIWQVRRKTTRLGPWPGDEAFAPVAEPRIERSPEEPPPIELDGEPDEAACADLSWMLAQPSPIGTRLAHVNWRRATLDLALYLARMLASTSGRGRSSTDPARRELRAALRALQVEGLGPPTGSTDESRKRDRWVEQHAEDHGRTKVEREDFAALFVELTRGQLNNRYRFDEDGRLVPCDPIKSWERARELHLALGGDIAELPEKPPRYSRKGEEIKNKNIEIAADAIEDLWRGYRDRRTATPGGSLFRAVSVRADLEWAAAELTRKGE